MTASVLQESAKISPSVTLNKTVAPVGSRPCLKCKLVFFNFVLGFCPIDLVPNDYCLI